MNIKDEYKKICEPPKDASADWFRKRGFTFEKVLDKLLSLDDLDPRSSYKTEGEQIDGSFFLNGSVFLLEAKWHKNELPASSIYQFKGKVDGKLIGTIGVFISMTGYSKDAVDALTLGKSLNVILFGKEDIDAAILKNVGFKNILKVKLRKAAEEGLVYFSSDAERVTKEGHTVIDNFSYDSVTKSIVQNKEADEVDSDLLIVCEGNSDKEIISLFATRILKERNSSKRIKIVVAMGKFPIPRVANAIATISKKTPILIVSDSDNEKDNTIELLSHNIKTKNWIASIPEPGIESWLSIKRNELRKKLIKGESIKKLLERLIEKIDLEKLAKDDESFQIFFETIINPNTTNSANGKNRVAD